MRIVAYDELSPSLDRQRAALQLGAFRRVFDRRTVSVYRRRWRDFADYVGLFAVERGELLGQVYVRRIPYRTATAVEQVAGIVAVTTRVDARRRGVARALLTEVHRREARLGIRFALLWTNRGWFAHELYESLGYRDVYLPSLAVRSVGPGGPGRGDGSLRPPSADELAGLESLYQELVGSADGFGPRRRGFLQVVHDSGLLNLRELRVYRRGGRTVGYAMVASAPYQLTTGELVASEEDLPRLVRALEREARGGAFVLSLSPFDRLHEHLEQKGYLVRPGGDWHALMACPLAGQMDAPALRHALAIDRPSFSCMAGDRF